MYSRPVRTLNPCCKISLSTSLFLLRAETGLAASNVQATDRPDEQGICRDVDKVSIRCLLSYSNARTLKRGVRQDEARDDGSRWIGAMLGLHKAEKGHCVEGRDGDSVGWARMMRGIRNAQLTLGRRSGETSFDESDCTVTVRSDSALLHLELRGRG